MTVRLAVRIFVAGAKVLEEFPVVDSEGTAVARLAVEHAERVRSIPGGVDRYLVEIEFLDEPDPLDRFFRIGTDPAGMVKPIEMGFRD